MAITRAKKGEIVEKLRKAFKDAKSLVFVNFHGLNVANATLMRRALKSEGVSYTVAKKTLTKLALEGEKFKGVEPALEGELALAQLTMKMVEDPNIDLQDLFQNVNGVVFVVIEFLNTNYDSRDWLRLTERQKIEGKKNNTTQENYDPQDLNEGKFLFHLWVF